MDWRTDEEIAADGRHEPWLQLEMVLLLLGLGALILSGLGVFV